MAGPATPCTPQPIGAALPSFTLPTLDGATESLDDRLRGRRGAVVVFWSGICSHCIRYDEYFNRFQRRHPEIALAIIAPRNGETADELRKAVADRVLTFSILHDADGAVARAWLAPQTPRCYLVDTGRVLRYRGAVDNYKYPNDPAFQPYLEPAVDAFVAGRPIERADTPSFGCAINSVYYLIPRPR